MSIWYCVSTKSIVNNEVSLSESLIKKTMNAIYNPKLIKITNNQTREITKFNANSEEYLKYDIKEINYLIYYELIAGGIKSLSTPIIYLVCGIMIINGDMQVGSLMAILTYSTNILSYFQNLIYAVEGSNGCLIPSKRINEFLDLGEENLVCKNLVTYDYDHLEFKNVSIKFDNQTILEDININLQNIKSVFFLESAHITAFLHKF